MITVVPSNWKCIVCIGLVVRIIKLKSNRKSRVVRKGKYKDIINTEKSSYTLQSQEGTITNTDCEETQTLQYIVQTLHNVLCLF